MYLILPAFSRKIIKFKHFYINSPPELIINNPKTLSSLKILKIPQILDGYRLPLNINFGDAEKVM
jgi:hypothetical protein